MESGESSGGVRGLSPHTAAGQTTAYVTQTDGYLQVRIEHKVHTVYIMSTTEYVPSSELGISHPLSRQRVCPTPGTKGGEGTLACG